MNEIVNATFLERLRDATSQAHQDLEDMPLSKSIINPDVTKEEYLHYLVMMQDVVTDTENNIFPLLESLIPDLNHRRKSNLIADDIRQLGGSRETQNPHPVTGSLTAVSTAFALGILYVVEGSSLGGRVILKNISNTLGYGAGNGGSYFAGYGAQTGSTWKAFLDTLQDYEINSGCGEEIIAGANYGFDAIKGHFINISRTGI